MKTCSINIKIIFHAILLQLNLGPNSYHFTEIHAEQKHGSSQRHNQVEHIKRIKHRSMNKRNYTNFRFRFFTFSLATQTSKPTVKGEKGTNEGENKP